MVNIKAVVLTCPQYHNTRVVAVRETWGKHFNTVFLSDYDYGDDIIGFEKIERGYLNVWKKYVEFFRSEVIDSDWYLFTDDDTFVNHKNIQELFTDNSGSICMGHVGILNPDATDSVGDNTGFDLGSIVNGELPIRYPGGGAGFILSAEAMREIRKSLNLYSNLGLKIPRCMNGDVTFGFWLKDAGVELINRDDMWWSNPTLLCHNTDFVKKQKTYHYVSPEMMRELYAL